MSKSVILVILLAALGGCVNSGSRYQYTEETQTYTVKATANVQSNSEAIDLEVMVVQDGQLVKHIRFGKRGEDNAQALAARTSAINTAAESASDIVDRIFRFSIPAMP